jgi:glyoxylate reductase
MTSTAHKLHQHAADTVMTLALLLARQASAAGVANAGWSLADKSLGLVGLDPVGEAVAKRASLGFGMKVFVHSDAYADQAVAATLGAECTSSIDHLLAISDVVSLHGRLGDSESYINAGRLNQMKRDAQLINGSHGGLVDEKALVHALWFETIGGAGLSVPASSLSRWKDFEACSNAIILDPADVDELAGFDALPSAMHDNIVDFSSAVRQRA